MRVDYSKMSARPLLTYGRQNKMKNKMSFATAILAVLTGSSAALAQGEPGPGGNDDQDATQSNSVPPSAAQPGDKWASWPLRFIDRPRTLPMGMIEAGGYFDISRGETVSATDTVTTTTTLGLSAGAGYGISDQLEVRASYGLTLDEFESKGPLAVGVGFGFAEGTLAIAGRGDFTYDFQSESGGIGLGPSVRYKLAPDLALFTSRQLEMILIAPTGFSKPSTLRLPIGVGYQASDQLYLFGETELASLSLKDSESIAILSDYFLLTAGGVFSLSGKLEVGGLLSTDLKNDAFDTLQVQLFGRVYL